MPQRDGSVSASSCQKWVGEQKLLWTANHRSDGNCLVPVVETAGPKSVLEEPEFGPLTYHKATLNRKWYRNNKSVVIPRSGWASANRSLPITVVTVIVWSQLLEQLDRRSEWCISRILQKIIMEDMKMKSKWYTVQLMTSEILLWISQYHQIGQQECVGKHAGAAWIARIYLICHAYESCIYDKSISDCRNSKIRLTHNVNSI
jgi:hypothetical protein